MQTTPTYLQLPKVQRKLVWAYQRGDRSPEARVAWREYRRDRERARIQRNAAAAGISQYALRKQREAARAREAQKS
jgi:hypothetical protein